MISLEAIVVVCGWLVSMFVALFIVPKLAAQKTMAKFGLTAVKNAAGDDIYAVLDPDGEPIKVPIQRVDKDGKATVSLEYAPLAYALPVIAAVQTKAYLTSAVQGKAGKMTQMANAAVLADMPLEQASTAMALEAFARGQYGKALMAYLAPRIAASLNQSGNAGQALTGNQDTRGGSRGRGPI